MNDYRLPTPTYTGEDGVKYKLCKCPDHVTPEFPQGTFLPLDQFNRDTTNQLHGRAPYCKEWNKKDVKRRQAIKKAEREKYRII